MEESKDHEIGEVVRVNCFAAIIVRKSNCLHANNIALEPFKRLQGEKI